MSENTIRIVARWGLPILPLALAIAQTARAYTYPLSPEAIREAYFLGKGDSNKRAKFFEKYTQFYPDPNSGQYVGMIEIETPYVLIAERVSQSVANYFAQDAEQDYLGKPAICRVLVQVYYGWGSASPTAQFQTAYVVRLKQNDREISSKKTWSEPLISNGSAPADPGFQMDVEYDAAKIDSGAPATVEVLAPDGQHVEQIFDLPSLR
jgi:hypothetical protein